MVVERVMVRQEEMSTTKKLRCPASDSMCLPWGLNLMLTYGRASCAPFSKE